MSDIKPLFLLAGGNFRDPESMIPLFARALKECERQKPRVAYLGVANGDSIPFFSSVQTLLEKAGAGDVLLVPLAKVDVDLSAARQTLAEADAIFLSGGEVEDGMCWLELHGLHSFLQELRGRGKLFFGVSAGSILMGSHWVRWENPADDSTAELFCCLGFIPTIFDTHAEDEGWKELKTALQLKGRSACGYGIPQGGMVIVDCQGKMTVVGNDLLCFKNTEGRVHKV